MYLIDQRIRYLKGLAAKDITNRFGITAFNGAHQFIVGTDEDGMILWAPHQEVRFIGSSLDDLIEWGLATVEEI